MPKWVIALVAAASFGLGWIASDLLEPGCTTTTSGGGRYLSGDVTVECRHLR